jgi:hypothetical protein
MRRGWGCIPRTGGTALDSGGGSDILRPDAAMSCVAGRDNPPDTTTGKEKVGDLYKVSLRLIIVRWVGGERVHLRYRLGHGYGGQ